MFGPMEITSGGLFHRLVGRRAQERVEHALGALPPERKRARLLVPYALFEDGVQVGGRWLVVARRPAGNANVEPVGLELVFPRDISFGN